ncbi:MAG: ATP-binding cassette domain-containing protein [Pyrinomonadaceae bacterium]
MPLIVNKISKRFGNIWALRDVSFEAESGSIIGLFGASGSGKTTLLKTVAGLIKPNGGTITLGSQDITATKAKDRGITYQSGHEEAGLKQLFGAFSPGESSGERQLNIFKETMAHAGKVLLLDEPFSHMDSEMRSACFAAVRLAARQRDRVVIFASSDFDQIIEFADEAAFLSGGEIAQSGTPQDIYENPASVEAARMTGEANLIEARRLTSTDAELPEFHTIDGGHRIFAQNVEKKRLGPINQNMTLAIRPEQVSMSVGSSFPEDNLLRAVVTGITFRGPTSLIEFDAAGLKIQSRVFKVVGLKIGDECMLGLPPHRILILKG